MKKERHKIVPAAYIILLRNHDAEVLLLQRANTGYMDGIYSLIAGHIEKGEMPTFTAVREAAEEASIHLTASDMKLEHVMYRLTAIDSRLDMFFAVRNWTGKIKNNEPDKCSDLNWFPVNDLPHNTIPYIRYAIECCLKKQTFSEFLE